MHKRMRAWVLVCLPALFAVVSPAPADAQIIESIGLRAQGMGGAFVAVADDATATWWNPAGLANGAYFNSLVEWDWRTDPDETRARAFAIAYPAFGVSYYRLTLASIQRPVGDTGLVIVTGDDRNLNVFGGTFGQSIGNHLVVASTVKLLHALDATTGDLDLGAMAAFGSMRLGFTVKNVIRPRFSAGTESFELPLQARAGVAFNRGPSGHADLTFAIDADLTETPTLAGDARHLAAGVEVWRLKRQLGLRAGFGMNTTGEARPSGSFGTSLALRAGFYADFQVTHGQDDIRNGWGLGLRVTF